MTTISRTVTLETSDCISCGVVFALPDHLLKSHLEHGSTFYCPNGHPMLFRESDVQKATKRAEQAEAESRRLAAERDGLLGIIHTKQAELGRISKRANAGVCQHCHRSFANVQRHMASKHRGP